ncbi:MAG: bifunctional N(6)-L-threonylcarbamoyladenine synthase/serine/threonine protein kinase [Halobacteriaceae archaeon]
MRILGIEGTAWAASAAIYDTASESISIKTVAYDPDSGGIHPREAAEHMRAELPGVIKEIIDDEDKIDAVAFSKGPGLGPCLRVAGTAARAMAQRLETPLIGVNHMVAHLEIGRHFSEFERPICLNASGANAHLLGYRNGRYQILGETMDTGVGNALDKFTRHVGWSHPGGPKIEAEASSGEYVDLPYVVKGMDFSFSGIMSAAKTAYDEGVPVEDVCFSLQENIFGMLTEVSERALSLTGNDELILGGGVGQNERLREMLGEMCEERGASFFAPASQYMQDNAGMIAVLGAKMYEEGQTIPVSESRIDPNFRPDEVQVTWITDDIKAAKFKTDRLRGAEAKVEMNEDRIIKHRVPKSYRHPSLDRELREQRTILEARLTSEARKQGVPTPLVYDVDLQNCKLVLQRVGEVDLDEQLSTDRVREVGNELSRLHSAGFVHGDPTTRNVRVGQKTYLIDFGLGYHTNDIEDYAMDLHVFEQSLRGTADEAEGFITASREGYMESGDERVLERLSDIDERGRYL